MGQEVTQSEKGGASIFIDKSQVELIFLFFGEARRFNSDKMHIYILIYFRK